MLCNVDMANANFEADPSSEDVGVSKFQVNGYYVFYRTYKHMLDSGVRLLETSAEYGDDAGLINSFRQLLTYDVNEKMLIHAKLTPLDSNGRYYSKDFDKLILNEKERYLQMYLIHYPAAPNSFAKNQNNKLLHTESWLAISKSKRIPRNINAVGVHTYRVEHLLELTEVIVVGPMVKCMQWYHCYNYSCGTSRTNIEITQNPIVISMAKYYNISSSQLLTLWALQRGESIIPRTTNSRYEVEIAVLSIRLTLFDLSMLDAAVIQSTNVPSVAGPSGCNTV